MGTGGLGREKRPPDGKLNNRTPEGYTPLVRATGEALKYFKDPKSSKSLLIITDGGDNLFYGEGQHTAEDARSRAEYHTVENYLQKTLAEKTHPDQRRRIPGRGRRQEAPGLQGIQACHRGPGGRYTSVSNTKQLAAVLGQYFLQLHYWGQGQKAAIS